MIQESAYMELLYGCSRWNGRIDRERKARVPFLDNQTRIAQRPGNLYRNAADRIDVECGDRVFVYPARRWRKRRRDPAPLRTGADHAVGVVKADPDVAAVAGLDADAHRILAVENPAARLFDAAHQTEPTDFKASQEAVALNLEHEFDDLSDSGDDLDDGSDGDDYYDESYARRRQRTAAPAKKRQRMRKRAQQRVFSMQLASSSADPTMLPLPSAPVVKPYPCAHCDSRYKSKAGVNYHLAHVHGDFSEYLSGAALAALVSQPNVDVSPDCDFCLGDANENKKTGKAEPLASCHDCGRSGHPTCLSFTPNMIVSTKKYGWQCLECKSCAICGTSENDEQLLFCDDCDHGFHLYCLNPPLVETPKDEWSCHLCQVEFGSRASHPRPPPPPPPPLPPAAQQHAPPPPLFAQPRVFVQQ